jgi:hypothetical protein
VIEPGLVMRKLADAPRASASGLALTFRRPQHDERPKQAKRVAIDGRGFDLFALLYAVFPDR